MKQKQKKFKKTKTYLNETMAEKQDGQKCMCQHVSELLLTDKFQHYLRMNATSYF